MTNLADQMPFAKHLGIEVITATPEKVVGDMAVSANFCTAGGNNVHGGALMAFADSLAAIGAFLTLPEGAGGTTTIESKTNFLGRAAKGVRLTGVSTPVSIGRRVSVWQTRIADMNDKSVALITQTQLVL